MDGQSKDSLYLGRLTATLAAVFITPATLLSRFQPLRNRELLSHAADDRNRTSSRVVYSAIQMLPVRSSIGKMICRDPNAGPKRWPSVKPLRAGGE